MNDNVGLTGALVVAMALVVAFFVFSHKIGALRAFGRYPISWAKLAALAGAAVLPACGAFGSIFIATWPGAVENPTALAGGMATIGWGCMVCMQTLQRVALKAPIDASGPGTLGE